VHLHEIHSKTRSMLDDRMLVNIDLLAHVDAF
jgi:hypothetical protein